MQSTHTGLLDILQLPIAARQVHIFSSLVSGSLLSIGQLCDHSCSTYFNKTKLYIMYNSRIIIQGNRDYTKLWSIDSKKAQIHSPNSVIDTPTIEKRIKFYTKSLFSTTLSTLASAITAG